MAIGEIPIKEIYTDFEYTWKILGMKQTFIKNNNYIPIFKINVDESVEINILE